MGVGVPGGASLNAEEFGGDGDVGAAKRPKSSDFGYGWAAREWPCLVMGVGLTKEASAVSLLESIADLPIAPFASGEVVIAEGSRPTKLYFLKSGRVEIVKGETRVAMIKTPGSVLGEMSLLLDTDATANVIALDTAEFYVADEPLEFLKAHPEVHVQVSKSLAYRLNAATQYLVDVKEQLKDCSDHVGMVDGVLDAILHRDLKKKVSA